MDEPKKVAELGQRLFPWKKQTWTLWEDRVELRSESPGERVRLPFYLHAIKEQPDRVIDIPWLWLLLGVACCGWLGWASSIPEALLAGAGLAIAAAHLPRMRSRWVYAYRPLGPEGPKARYEPHLFLLASRPSPEAVQEFIDKIRAVQKRHVERLKADQEAEGAIGYVRELDRFAQLRERNVVTEDEFTEVKSRLLNLRPRRIGF